jgi:hypothetical protein
MEMYGVAWVESQVAQATELWLDASGDCYPGAVSYGQKEQEQREHAYDEALTEVESGLQNKPQEQLVASFGRFAARALDLDAESIHLLTQQFLPIGTELARQARQFDPHLGMSEVIQAARNAWTACGLQPLLGEPVSLTPSIFGYSLMYPYSDNYLDDEDTDAQDKRQFSRRFQRRLLGDRPAAANHRERALWKLVELVETQYPRALFPSVFECMLAIHQAQEQSIHQLHAHGDGLSNVLRLTCAKGGTSVVADACLARGSLSGLESQFAFEWGVLLQLGDDLQDLRDDLRRGSTTLFTLTAASGQRLDRVALQLLGFSGKVSTHMDALPYGAPNLKNLLKMSWRSLILRAIADSHEFFSPGFLHETERFSPFRFHFLRKRSNRLASAHGLYTSMFNDVLAAQ